MIPAENQRERTTLQGRPCFFEQALSHFSDDANSLVFLHSYGSRNHKVPPIDHFVTVGSELFEQAGVAEGRWTNVRSAFGLPQIERNTPHFDPSP
jgi:hypothetical protein